MGPMENQMDNMENEVKTRISLKGGYYIGII